MIDLKVILYINDKASIVDRAISLWQKILGFERHFITHVEFHLDGTGYSSSYRDGGVRAKKIDLNKNWIYTELLITEEQRSLLLEFFEKEKGKKYDLKNIFFNKILGLKRDNPDRWICSEFTYEALAYAGIIEEGDRSIFVYPPDLYYVEGKK
jgi:hypothetical protein